MYIKKREEDDERRVNRIFYLCDGKACPSCSWKYLPTWESQTVCKHTSHPEHALNGAVKDPTYSDRFEKIDGNWWEVVSERIHDGRNN